MIEVVRRTAEQIFIPLTVGGGVRSPDDVDQLLRAGADKCVINTAAIAPPEVISEISQRFGNQVLVLSIDARRVTDETPEGAARTGSAFEVTTHVGRRRAGSGGMDWLGAAAGRGGGEVLLPSIDADGSGEGFDLELIRLAREGTSLPLIASGGAGIPEHFPPAVHAGADAVLA